MMDDEQVAPMPLHITQRVVLTVDAWPERTAFDPDALQQPHRLGLTVDGDTITVTVANGTATYRIRRDLSTETTTVADLVDGDSPAQLKRAAKKYGAA